MLTTNEVLAHLWISAGHEKAPEAEGVEEVLPVDHEALRGQEGVLDVVCKRC